MQNELLQYPMGKISRCKCDVVVCFLLGNSPASEFRRWGEIPRRKHTTFRTGRKFEIKEMWRYL